MTNIELITELDNLLVSESKLCDVENCKQYLSSFTEKLTILTQNIRSIFKNFDNLSTLLHRLDICCDVIVLTECWLKNSNNLPFMPGYNMSSSKINYNQNDGIVVYVRSNLNVCIEEISISECNAMLIKVDSDIAILALYRPPSFKNTNIFTDSLNDALQKLSSFKNLILVGDININIHPDNNDRAQDYLNICSFHGLLPAHTLPTHQSGSCLDHFMLKSSFPSITLVTNSTITDHSAVLLTFNRKIPQTQQMQFKSIMNVNKLDDDLCNIDFAPVYNSDDADFSMTYLINNVQQVLLRNTQYICLRNKNYNIKPWITPGLIRCMRHRDKLHMKAKSNPANLILQTSYKRYRNYCNDLLKKMKINYEKINLEKAKSNNKKVWKFIKNLAFTSKEHESSSHLLLTHSSQLTAADSVNDFFVHIGKNLAQNVQSQSYLPLTRNTSTHSTHKSTLKSFVLLDTDQREVERIIMGLNDDSAVGWDNISNKVLKQYKHILIPPLTHIFGKCLSEGIFPKCLKKAVVVPVHKSGNKDQITNYRPISLLPAISKILEKIINNRLVKYLEKHSILSKNQFGFRSKLSTNDAVHQLTNYVAQELDSGNQTVGIFLDLAKAFDAVSVPILLQKLESLGIRGNQLKLLENYLNDRTQCVKIGNVFSSDLKNTSFGVPQGSILGPTLFLVYINDLCNLELNGGRILSYADDTALLFSAKSEKEVYELAQRGFNTVNNWLQKHLLTLNANKTKYIQFNMRVSKSSLTNPKLYAHQCINTSNNMCKCPIIDITNKVKYLGVIIDKTLSFKSHIDALCGRIRKLMFVFKKLRTILDFKLMRQVYFALCQSVLTYCISSWGGVAKTLILTLERAQRAVLKVATSRPFLYPTNLLYFHCQVLTVRQLFILSTVLKQHTALPYTSNNTQKRRKDIVCPLDKTTKRAFSSRFYVFLGPLLYNRLNRKYSIYTLNYYSTKSTLQKALQNMSYEETENLLLVEK
jgi:hypothetical protein